MPRTLAIVILLTFSTATAHAVDARLITAMKSADPVNGPVLRRPKFLTDGSYDAADPSAPMQLHGPHGESVWAVLLSGGSVIYDDSLGHLLRGGTHPLRDISFQYPDGQPVTTKPYRINAAPWDPDIACFAAHCVGYAGMMERRTDGSEPTRARDNETRSRHAFALTIEPGAHATDWQQTWRDLGPVQGNRPRETPGHWLSPVHAHGYGSHYVEDTEGKPYLFFEEVAEERTVKGRFLPYRTEILVRALDESRTRGIGPKVAALKVAPWGKPDRPYRATVRANGAGFLIEGPHLVEAKVAGEAYYLMFFSAGDAFTDQYGSFYAYRRKAAGLVGPFTPAVDEHGELINVTAELTKRIDGTWGVGRLDPFWADGKLWATGHVILKEDIPDGETKSGWPPNEAELIKRARRTLLVPLELSLPHGRPVVTVSGL